MSANAPAQEPTPAREPKAGEHPAREPRYVYGVLRADQEPPKMKGIAGAPLHEVASGNIAALVSDLNDLSLKLGRKEITTHVEVLDKAQQDGTVLPMRFGVVMDGEPAVKEHLLDAHREELERQLKDLAGKVELRIRAIYEEERLLREVIAEDAEIAKLRQEVHGKPEDATYYARIRLGELVAHAIERKREADAAAIERKREADAAAILKPLEPLAAASSVGEPSNERVAVSASFLVEEKRVPEFDKAVDEVGRTNADRIKIKYTGPLPPHSFVTLTTEG